MKNIIINGKSYNFVIADNYSCDGCAFDCHRELCMQAIEAKDCGSYGQWKEGIIMKTAEEMRKITDDAKKLDGNFLKEETEEVISAIHVNATQGKDTLIVYTVFHEIIISRLDALGYTVQRHDGGRSDDYTSISW